MVNLSKPLAVLRKKIIKAPSSADDMDIDVSEGQPEGAGPRCEYEVAAVVKKKLLFSKRPMPITNAASVPILAMDGKTRS